MSEVSAFVPPSPMARLLAIPAYWFFRWLYYLLPLSWITQREYPPRKLKHRLAVWAYSNAWFYAERSEGRV